MRAVLMGFAVATMAGVVIPAMGITTVLDPWDTSDPNDELNFFEIYNDIFGTNFTSTNGATGGDLGSGGMDALDFPGEIFDCLDPLDGEAMFEARFAGNGQRFGYYTNPDGTLPTGSPNMVPPGGELVHLFDVINPMDTVIPGPTQTILAGDLPIGFYLNSRLGSGRTWYSETALNVDGMDHMIAFQAVESDGMGGFVVRTDQWLIGFEDLFNLGDVDYNDLVVLITLPQDTQVPDVPEPTTAGLLLLGLAGVALRRRFNA